MAVPVAVQVSELGSNHLMAVVHVALVADLVAVQSAVPVAVQTAD